MTIFLTADTHFYHRRINELCNRPFSSVEEMNEEIIARWNEIVKQQDTVFVLGDVCMGLIDESLGLIKRLKGHKYLIPGNHDRVWRSYYSSFRRMLPWRLKYMQAGFEIIYPEHFLLDNHIMLSHIPYDSEDEVDRYVKFRPKDNGIPLLHGHVHNAWHKKMSSAGTPMLNVGVDVNNFYPVELSEALSYLG